MLRVSTFSSFLLTRANKLPASVLYWRSSKSGTRSRTSWLPRWMVTIPSMLPSSSNWLVCRRWKVIRDIRRIDNELSMIHDSKWLALDINHVMELLDMARLIPAMYDYCIPCVSRYIHLTHEASDRLALCPGRFME